MSEQRLQPGIGYNSLSLPYTYGALYEHLC